MEGQQVIRALGDAWGLVHSCSPPNPPLEAAARPGLSLGHTRQLRDAVRGLSLAGLCLELPQMPLHLTPPRPSTHGAHEPPGHMGSAECSQELETLLSHGAGHRTAPLGGSLPSPWWDLQPLLCPLPPLSPHLRAETGPPASAIRLCSPQTVALFFQVTPAPTPGPAGWRRA